MAILTDGRNTAGGQAIETVSKAARVELYDAAGNKVSKLNGSVVNPTDEGLLLSGVNDGNTRLVRVDRSGGIATATPTILLTEQFEGTTISTSRWTIVATTMAATQSSAAGLLINSGSILTANTGYLLRSLRSFARNQKSPLHFKARARANFAAANSVTEIGLGDASTFNGAHTNGAYWQYTSGGQLQPVLTYNGVDITGTPVTGLNSANFYTFDILIDDDSVLFTIQDSATGSIVAERSILVPSTQPKIWSATRIFAFARLYITGTAAATPPSLTISQLDCVALDAADNKPWREQMSTSGYGGGLLPTTFAQSSNWGNSAAPSSATLSNTAAGYTTLGGLFQFAAIAGATTDYALFGFQAPTPYSFICTGIDIETWNTGAAVATTPTLLVWGLAYDLSAVSLATSGARIGIGSQDLPIGAAVGARATSVTKNFDTPIVTNPGRFLDVILRMPVASATASQLIQGMVTLRGYFD